MTDHISDDEREINSKAEQQRRDAESTADKYIQKDGTPPGSGKPNLKVVGGTGAGKGKGKSRAKEDPRVALFKAACSRLARLDPILYQMERKEAAENLGVTMRFLDRQVELRRPKTEKDLLCRPYPKPWPKPVDGIDLLGLIRADLLRFTNLPRHAADFLALWILAAYCLNYAEQFPRIRIMSVEFGSGKSVLMQIILNLAPKGYLCENATAPLLWRLVDAERPTVLLDEAETYIGPEFKGPLNSGYHRGGSIPRHDKDEYGNYTPRNFSTFCPLVVASNKDFGEGFQPFYSRAVTIQMERALPGEVAERFNESTYPMESKPIGQQAARWFADHEKKISEASDPDLPSDLLNRYGDLWRFLFIIANIVGGDWLDRIKHAAGKLTQHHYSPHVKFLSHIRDVYLNLEAKEDHNAISSVGLCQKLSELEDFGSAGEFWTKSPRRAGWALKKAGLDRFNIKSKDVRPDKGPNVKGFEWEQFKDAFKRYLPAL